MMRWKNRGEEKNFTFQRDLLVVSLELNQLFGATEFMNHKLFMLFCEKFYTFDEAIVLMRAA